MSGIAETAEILGRPVYVIPSFCPLTGLTVLSKKKGKNAKINLEKKDFINLFLMLNCKISK